MSDLHSTSDDEERAPAARVLVIDDEPLIRQLCARILERGGYALETAANADEALEAIESADVDVVLCDILMPRVPGHRLVERLREYQPKMRVIYMSGHDLNSEALGQVDLADDAVFLQKPFGAFDLLDTIELILRGESSPGDGS